MTAGTRQAALCLAALGVLAFFGLAHQSPPGLPAGAEAAGPTTTITTAVTSSTSPASSEAADTTTTTSRPASTTTAAPRAVEIVVYPSSASASVTLTPADGEPISGGSPLAVTATGPIQAEVGAEGYRTEMTTVEADFAGTFEVFLDPPDQLVDRRVVWTTGAAPKQVAFTPDASELWVTLLGGPGLEVYDPGSGEMLAAIDLPEAGSVEVIFDSAGTTAWVSQMETASVYEIDVATRQIRRTLNTGGSWTKVVLLDPNEERLWASNWVSNDVSEFDLATGEMVRRIPTVTTPRGLATDPDGSRLYVTGYDSGDIQVIDLTTGEGTVIADTGGAMRHLVADPSSNLIYASDMALDQIFAIDTTTDTVASIADTDRLPNTVDISPDGQVLAVSNRGRNNPETYYLPGPQWGSVLLIDTTTGEILDAIVGGNQPTGLDLSADGTLLAFSDFLDNRVTVLSVPSTSDLRAGDGGRADSYRNELEK
ncbi:MAG TPA: YncE family protein [Acidimicrobiia bacterium]|nr:YncE family protein [Acidimicrobiia bacterium]